MKRRDLFSISIILGMIFLIISGFIIVTRPAKKPIEFKLNQEQGFQIIGLLNYFHHVLPKTHIPIDTAVAVDRQLLESLSMFKDQYDKQIYSTKIDTNGKGKKIKAAGPKKS